jgi:hypothetical protein
MELLLEAAENGKPEAVTTQLETALFLEGNPKLG